MNDFKYLEGIRVNDCYADKDFEIKIKNHEIFSHLILTGKNGSGKSTILKSIDKLITSTTKNQRIQHIQEELLMPHLQNDSHKFQHFANLKEELFLFQATEIQPNIKLEEINIYSFFKPERDTYTLSPVDLRNLNQAFNPTFDQIYKQLKQYLFTKERYRRDYFYENKKEDQNIEKFFKKINEFFQSILGKDFKELNYISTNSYYDFQLVFKSKKIGFNQLPHGFSAVISMIMDFQMKVDLIQNKTNNFDEDPSGIVLIDEPETHLHLELQYEIMPLLSKFFPKIQFVVATHSPAIASSLKNATVFDLTTKESRTDIVLGSSFSELMVDHFGLDNEYSNFTDKIFEEINNLKTKFHNNPQKLKQGIFNILDNKRQYLSSGLILDLESTLGLIENDKY